MKGSKLTNKIVFKRLIIGLSLVIAAAFFVYKQYDDIIITQTVYETVAYDTVETKVLFLRDEKPLNTAGNNGLIFVASQSEKLAKGDKYALSFKNSLESEKYFEKENIKKELERYKILNNSSKVGAENIASAERVVDESFMKLLTDFNGHDNSSIDSEINDFRDKLTFFQNSISNEKKDFSYKIRSLEDEQKLLESGGIPESSYFTDTAGYFSRFTDGYENLVNYKDVTKLTCTDFDLLTSNIYSDDLIEGGKIVSSYTFYALAVLENKDLLRMKLPIYGENLSVKGFELAFGQSDSYKIEAEVISINSCEERSLVVFKCKDLNESSIDLRLEDATICFNKQNGLRVSKEALRFDDDNNPGVYVKSLKLIRFVKINIIGEFGDYLLVSKNMPIQKESAKTTEKYESTEFSGEETKVSKENKTDEVERILQTYDEVVVKGKRLYARKHN